MTTDQPVAEGSLNGARIRVREMRLQEVDLRIGYFHNASDDYLRTLGADRARLPTPEAWRARYERDFERPVEERDTYSLVWELEESAVGFSTVDHIEFGREALMHLHILEPGSRRRGMGTAFVRLSAAIYFEALHLQRLYCQPNAFNVAPNRTLQRAGFKYVWTKDQMAPSEVNFPQPITRWVLEAAPQHAHSDSAS